MANAERFPRGKSLSNYWGLTPAVNDSGDAKGRRGRIIKAGSTISRWLLGQMTLHVLRKDPLMKIWYKGIRSRRGSKIARVAVMRRVSVVIRNMLVERQPYDQCRRIMEDRQRRQVTPNQAKTAKPSIAAAS